MSEPSQVVLLMVPFAGFDRGLLDGIARYAQIHGPWVFYLSGDNAKVPLPVVDSLSGKLTGLARASGTIATLPLPNLSRWGATGVIGRIQTRKIARKIVASGLPVVAIDRSADQLVLDSPLAGVSEIRADSYRAGTMAAEHFLDRGFRHFAFCGFKGRHWSEGRQAGFCERLREAGFACDVFQPTNLTCGLSWDREQPMVLAWLKSLPMPVAILACNDIRGRQVMETTLLAGVTVPDDVAVVGVDDDRLVCNLSNPPLSSVALSLEQAGYQAAEHLDSLMKGTTHERRTIMVDPLWVVARRSTDTIATEDRHVAVALRFIRDQAKQPISVDDVVGQTGISRRGLEIRFRRVVKRGVRDEIQRVRLAHAKQLLLETNLSAERIAQVIGFGSLAYLSSVFRREVGMKLTEFRRQMRLP